MGVDIIDLFRCNAGILQCGCHRPGGPGPLFVGLRDVCGVAACATSEDFAKNRGTTFFCVFEFFEDEDPSSFAEHEPIAIQIERTAGAGRFLVAFGEGPHVGEPADSHRRDGCFGAAGDHHLGLAVLDGFQRVADGVRCARTGGGDGVVGASQSIADRQVAAGRVEH